MTTAYTNDLRLSEMATGENAGTWGNTTNTNLELISEAFGYGTENLASNANATITMADGAADAVRSIYLKITSTTLDATRIRLSRVAALRLPFRMAKTRLWLLTVLVLVLRCSTP